MARVEHGGATHDIGCGRGSRAEVERIAMERVAQRFGGALVGEGVESSGAAPAEDVIAHNPPPAPSSDPNPARAAEIAAKLRGLFDRVERPGVAVEPDDVLSPGESEDDGDGEAGELLADVIAEGAVAGTVKLGSTIAKARKPKRRANDPNERCLGYLREGTQHRLRQLLGRSSTLGPDAKLLIGFTGVIVSMNWGADEVEGAAAAPAPAPAKEPPREPAAAPAHEDLEAAPEARQLVPQAAASGRFR